MSLFIDDMFVQQKAKLCVTKETKYRRNRKAIKKERRYELALKQQLEVGKIPENALTAFEELYQDAFSRISMVRKYPRKEYKGKVVGSQKSQYVGPSLNRLVTYIAELYPQEPSDRLKTLLKDMFNRCATKVDKNFCEDIFEFQDYVMSNETLTLRDHTTYNIYLLKGLKTALPEKHYDEFIATLAEDPWVRCTGATSKVLWRIFLELLKQHWERETGIVARDVYLGSIQREEFVRFKLSTDKKDGWHTAETDGVARLVAKALNAEITEIETVNPHERKSFEIRDSKNAIVRATLVDGGIWQQAEIIGRVTP